MIITQTPLRISFAGGGTDLPEFFTEHEGCVLSSAIDKYIFAVIKERFDDKIRVGYTRTEMVDDIDEIEHELVRECLRVTGLRSGLEIVTVADIPSEGSGLGSSSTVTVGLLHAMYAYKGELVTASRLAEEACHIEIDVLGKPIGKQDQYIAAYGGIRMFRFRRDNCTDVVSLDLSPDASRRLGESLMLFYTGVTRQAASILEDQRASVADRLPTLQAMKGQVEEMEACLTTDNLNKVGRLLHAGWQMKKSLSDKISSSSINELYERALDAGAIGGKIAGAGGGGFMLLMCPPDRQRSVRQALDGMKELPFQLERDGSKIVLNMRRG